MFLTELCLYMLTLESWWLPMLAIKQGGTGGCQKGDKFASCHLWMFLGWWIWTHTDLKKEGDPLRRLISDGRSDGIRDTCFSGCPPRPPEAPTNWYEYLIPEIWRVYNNWLLPITNKCNHFPTGDFRNKKYNVNVEYVLISVHLMIQANDKPYHYVIT